MSFWGRHIEIIFFFSVMNKYIFIIQVERNCYSAIEKFEDNLMPIKRDTTRDNVTPQLVIAGLFLFLGLEGLSR